MEGDQGPRKTWGRSGTQEGVRWGEVRDPGGWGEDRDPQEDGWEVRDPRRMGECQGPQGDGVRSGTQEDSGEVRDPGRWDGDRSETPGGWGEVGNPGQWDERSRTWVSASQPQVSSVLVLFAMPRPAALPQSIMKLVWPDSGHSRSTPLLAQKTDLPK